MFGKAELSCPAFEDAFGNTLLELSYEDFTARGFRPGDSVDVCFGNGVCWADIPYFNGCYVREGERYVYAQKGYPHVRIGIAFGKSYKEAGLTENASCRILLRERGKYLSLQNLLSVEFTLHRKDYTNDAFFANYRSLSGGAILPNRFYRSVSPFLQFDNAFYVNKLMERDGIAFVLNTCDTPEELKMAVASGRFDGQYAKKLYEQGKILSFSSSIGFRTEEFKAELVSSLRVLMRHEGPYLTHCMLGIDRTGFICCLLEAFAGACYTELIEDYMRTFEFLCGITKENRPEKYATLADLRGNWMLSILLESAFDAESNPPLEKADFQKAACLYLKQGSMERQELAALYRLLCGKESPYEF